MFLTVDFVTEVYFFISVRSLKWNRVRHFSVAYKTEKEKKNAEGVKVEVIVNGRNITLSLHSSSVCCSFSLFASRSQVINVILGRGDWQGLGVHGESLCIRKYGAYYESFQPNPAVFKLISAVWVEQQDKESKLLVGRESTNPLP